MKIIETERLILREFLPSDDTDFFRMDADSRVHQYLGNTPTTSIEQSREIIANIRQQYVTNGIGRWATIEKSSGQFIGWSGLKFITEEENKHVHYYDVGYRLMPAFWGKGYATETCKTWLAHGFTTMGLQEIIGCAHEENIASRKALEKSGLTFVEKFMWKDIRCDWLKITKEEWKIFNGNV